MIWGTQMLPLAEGLPHSGCNASKRRLVGFTPTVDDSAFRRRLFRASIIFYDKVHHKNLELDRK